MEAWTTILLAFGGNAAMLAVLGWLSKSVLEKILTRDSLRIENELKASAATELEKLRSTLAVTATERQVRFSKLHERRAEVIAETYGLLKELHYRLSDYVKIFERAGERSKEDRRKDVSDAHKKFFDFYTKNKLFLSKTAVEKIDDINRQSIQAFYQFFYGVETLPPHLADETDKWSKIFDQVNEKMPVALQEIEDEFRKLLGDET